MCFASAAYRGKDFLILLDETINQIQRDALAVVKGQPPMNLRAPVSMVSVSPGRRTRVGKTDRGPSG